MSTVVYHNPIITLQLFDHGAFCTFGTLFCFKCVNLCERERKKEVTHTVMSGVRGKKDVKSVSMATSELFFLPGANTQIHIKRHMHGL